MTRSSRHREKSSHEKDLSGAGAYDGSAARTRPFSLEDIMIRRKNKKVTSEAKDGSCDSGNLLRNDNGEKIADHPEHDGDCRYGKESSFINAKKATEDAAKRSLWKEETTSLKERSLVKAGVGDKERHDTDTNLKVKLGFGTGRVKERKSEKESHHRSRTEEYSRDEKETGKGKEHRNGNKSPHRSRNEERMRDDMETVRSKEHKDELDTATGRVKERKSEKESHHRSRTEERSRDDKEIGKAREHRSENKSPHRSRNEERVKDDKDTVRYKEHKDEKQHYHRSKIEKRLRDDAEIRKEHSENSVGKEKFLDSDLVKFERGSKREHRSREERRDRPELDAGAVKKHSSGKYNLESTEKKDRNKDNSRSYDEGSERKRRRSRSPEFRARDRSISLSPRGHKRAYDGREHGESSLHSSKDGKQHSDLDRNRVTSNGGHTSNHSWRHGGRGSGLGGYSPRKRRSEAAIRTPSPTARSPEKKGAGWDHTPRGTAAMPDATQSPHHSVTVEHNLSNAATVSSSDLEYLSGALLSTKAKDATVKLDQLTQATQPMRRLYVENLPASASDKSVMECFNNFLMSSGANHIQQNQPCIGCTIHKEKGQAVVDFVTAEDARKALSFDGRSFSNSILKVSRPKDLFEAANGVAEKPVSTVDAVSEIVKDSPQKIFVGGISKALSCDMLREIVSAFGRLKAFHFEAKNDLEEACAFLEYDDESITPKACAGLNGMKLGGKILTVRQAVPEASIEENTGTSPFYEIPEHAKPLLLEPTKVLRLRNVFKTEHMSSLPEAEVEETLEDIRLECARFGTVKSINVVRCESNSGIADQTNESLLPQPEDESLTKGVVETREQDAVCDYGEKSAPEVTVNDKLGEDKPNEDLAENETSAICQIDSGITTYTDVNSQEAPPQLASCDKITNDTECVLVEDRSKNVDMMVEEEFKDEEANPELLDTSLQLNNNVGESEGSEKDESKQKIKHEEVFEDTSVFVEEASLQLNNTVGGLEASEKDEGKQDVKHDEVFEHGSVFVEYVRSEASCIAAHSLHGRLYGEQSVLVNYIPHDLYISRFRKRGCSKWKSFDQVLKYELV